MLVNGVEVGGGEENVKQSQSIQQAINAAKEMESSAQSGIDPKQAAKHFADLTGGMDQGEMNIFFDEQAGYGDDINGGNRSSKYDTYSEMDTMEFIHRGLELIADDSTQPNDDGDVIKVYSDDESIKDVITNLMINKLDMNNELWSIVYETIKFGDNFYEIIVDDYKKPKEIMRIRYLEPRKVERIELNGRLSHFTYKTSKVTSGPSNFNKTEETQEYKLFPWQILHFKIENKETAPYGGSLLRSGVRTYRRLVMLEDIMLVYRISRAPERRVFYIDVGNLNPIEAKRFLNNMKNSYRSQSFIDENGNINKKANVMSITSDIFVPVREGSSGTRIETLQGGQAMGASGEDPLLAYFKDKILKTMNIPPQYMGETADNSRNLSQLDTKFGRFIERIQAQITKGINKLAALELFFKGFKKEDLHNFKIELTPPSNVKEITEIDIFNQRMALIGTIIGLEMFPKSWIMKKIMKMSDKEVADIEMQKQLEASAAGAAGAEAGGLDMGGAGAAGGMPPDMGGGEVPADMGGGEVPAEAEAPAEELVASAMVQLLGQDFLLENKDDFFKIVKAIRDNKNVSPMLPMFDSLSKLMSSKIEVPEKKNKNNVAAQSSIGELKGLDFDNRMITVYESEVKRKMVKGVTSMELIYEEKKFKCGNKTYITED